MIVEERMRTYINSLDMGNTPFLEELEKEARELEEEALKLKQESEKVKEEAKFL